MTWAAPTLHMLRVTASALHRLAGSAHTVQWSKALLLAKVAPRRPCQVLTIQGFGLGHAYNNSRTAVKPVMGLIAAEEVLLDSYRKTAASTETDHTDA